MDDVIEMMTQCELHIPMGNSTVMVVHSIVSLVDPDRTPRSQGNPIPLAIIVSWWIELSKTFLEVMGRRP
jgi:hypothetical protein